MATDAKVLAGIDLPQNLKFTNPADGKTYTTLEVSLEASEDGSKLLVYIESDDDDEPFEVDPLDVVPTTDPRWAAFRKKFITATTLDVEQDVRADPELSSLRKKQIAALDQMVTEMEDTAAIHYYEKTPADDLKTFYPSMIVEDPTDDIRHRMEILGNEASTLSFADYEKNAEVEAQYTFVGRNGKPRTTYKLGVITRQPTFAEKEAFHNTTQDLQEDEDFLNSEDGQNLDMEAEDEYLVDLAAVLQQYANKDISHLPKATESDLIEVLEWLYKKHNVVLQADDRTMQQNPATIKQALDDWSNAPWLAKRIVQRLRVLNKREVREEAERQYTITITFNDINKSIELSEYDGTPYVRRAPRAILQPELEELWGPIAKYEQHDASNRFPATLNSDLINLMYEKTSDRPLNFNELAKEFQECGMLESRKSVKSFPRKLLLQEVTGIYIPPNTSTATWAPFGNKPVVADDFAQAATVRELQKARQQFASGGELTLKVCEEAYKVPQRDEKQRAVYKTTQERAAQQPVYVVTDEMLLDRFTTLAKSKSQQSKEYKTALRDIGQKYPKPKKIRKLLLEALFGQAGREADVKYATAITPDAFKAALKKADISLKSVQARVSELTPEQRARLLAKLQERKAQSGGAK